MEDMATFDPIGDPGMTVTFTSEDNRPVSYHMVPTMTTDSVVGTKGNQFYDPSLYGRQGGAWTYPNIYTPDTPGDLEITHVVEEEDGLVGYTEDGTKVLLGDWVPTAVSMRVRALLERLAGGEELDESDLEKFCYLKRLLELQQEELENTANRIQFIEQLIAL
jgi:hypothetical protein